MQVTAIYGSPRKYGNTDLLLDAFLKEFKNSDHIINRFYLRKMSISPCIECEKCYTTGTCVLDDDMKELYPLFKTSDLVVLSSPVFFYGLNALAKAMVDRSQCCWAEKYLLKEKDPGLNTPKTKGTTRCRNVTASLVINFRYLSRTHPFADSTLCTFYFIFHQTS